MMTNAENISESDVIKWESSSIEKFAPYNSTQLSNVPENNLLQTTSNAEFYSESNFSESLINLIENVIESMNYSDDIYSRKTSNHDSVFADYPPQLLCLGATCFIVFAIVGVFGNFFSIIALSKCQKLRNATTAFIVNLCVADLLFCSFSMPLSALTFIEKRWHYGNILCKLFPLVRYSNGAVSLFSVIAITINRYILIVHPKIYSVVYTKRNMVIMISLIWVLSALILLPPLLGIWGTLGYDRKVGTCTILKLDGKSPKIFLYVIGFVVPSIIFIICYTRIFLVVRKASKKSQRKEDKIASTNITFIARKKFSSKIYRHSEMPETHVQHREKNELRVLRVMLVVFILFVLCYFPVTFVKIFHKEDDLHIMNVIGYLGVYFSNIINPIIYILMSREYRMAYKELLCKNSVKGQLVNFIV